MKSTEAKSVKSAGERFLAGTGVLIISAGAALIGYFNPTTAGFFPVCPLFKLTGILCPGCGLTRGFHALFHGDILTALHFNALLPIFALAFGFVFVSLVLIAVRGRGLSWRILPPASLYGFLVLAIAFFILRNLPFYPFTLLAP